MKAKKLPMPTLWVVLFGRGNEAYKHRSDALAAIGWANTDRVGVDVSGPHRYTPAKPAKVCVWTEPAPHGLGDTSCGREGVYLHKDYIACPYCGGKIRVSKVSGKPMPAAQAKPCLPGCKAPMDHTSPFGPFSPLRIVQHAPACPNAPKAEPAPKYVDLGMGVPVEVKPAPTPEPASAPIKRTKMEREWDAAENELISVEPASVTPASDEQVTVLKAGMRTPIWRGTEDAVVYMTLDILIARIEAERAANAELRAQVEKLKGWPPAMVIDQRYLELRARLAEVSEAAKQAVKWQHEIGKRPIAEFELHRAVAALEAILAKGDKK